VSALESDRCLVGSIGPKRAGAEIQSTESSAAVCEGAALAGKRRVDLIKASIEVSDETGCFSVTVCAEDIQQAVELAMDRYPGRAVKVKFPLDPETFFVRDNGVGTEIAELVTPERVTDKPDQDGAALARAAYQRSRRPADATADINVEGCEKTSKPVKAMVLAAGKGTRLFPLTDEIPKPMAPVVDTPIIEHIFGLLATHGIQEVHVNVYYLADALLAAYGEESQANGMKVHLSREDELKGTAGGVKRLADRFEDTFVVISGDALTDIDVGELVAFHKEREALATIALHRVYDTSEFGVVEVDGEGNILGFQEKPDPKEAISTLANTGIYVLEPRALDYIPEATFFDFAKDVFPKFLERAERFVGYQGDFYWSDIGTLEAYRQAQYDVLSGKVRVRIPGTREEDLWACGSARLHPTVAFKGRVLVGQDAVVGRGVTLIGDTTVGSDCWVRPAAQVKRSILLPGASIGDGAYLEDCIIGHGYYVRPGEHIRGGVLVRGARRRRSLLGDLRPTVVNHNTG
jgi:mannose-1-phosphate guanylyltransferase